MRRFVFFVLFAISCATTSVPPSEKLAFDYTKAYLGRDTEGMQGLASSQVEHPVPNARYSSLKAIRNCPPQPAKGGPEAQTILVLIGDTQNQYFEAMQVTVAHYGDKWLVIDAHRVSNENGLPQMYSRTCRPVYGTYGTGTSY